MKKWFGVFFILIICIFVGHTTTFSYAEETTDSLEISTLYPENVLYYQNINSIDNIAVNDNFIAYNLSGTTLSILNKISRNLVEISDFNNILDFKFVSSTQLVVIDYSNDSGVIKFIDLDNSSENYTNTTIEGITLSSIQLVDICSNNNKILIGFIKSSTTGNNYFELFEIELINSIPSAPVKKDTYTSEQFNTSKNLVITESQNFVVFNNSDNQPRLLTRTYGSSTVTTKDIITNIQLLDYYSYNSTNYLVAFTLENLRLLPLDDLENIDTTLTELSISDIDIYDGKIYIGETNEKSINSYIITTDQSDNTILQKDNVLIASSSNALGRFNNVNDLYVQGNTLYLSDTKNNRIQIIDDGKVTLINDLLVDTQPHSIQIDTEQNIYFVEKTSTTTSNIAKYSLDTNQEYSRLTNYSTYDLVSLGLVSDTTITINNELFILDYTNSKLLSLNEQTGIQPKLTFEFTLTAFSKIEYIRTLNLLAVLNSNVIYLIDIVKLSSDANPIIDTLAVSNCADLSSGLSSIITLSDNQIRNINIIDGIMHTSTNSLSNDTFSYLSTINYNIATNQIYAFNSLSQSIVYFDYICDGEKLEFTNIKENTYLTTSTQPLAITVLNNAIIYDLPYNLGNQHTDISSCVGIELYNDTYYRVLFKDNNSLTIGFLNKNNAQITSHNTSSKISVITTNLKVPVYKYPTILKYNNQAIINEYIPINTSLTISSKCFPITIDDKLFYAYENNGKLGYIFNADVILNDNSNITTLYNNNATIKVIGENEIYIYDEDKTTILATISNDDRISVENYDKHSKYTLVHFKTDTLNTITGYVKTDYIEMDKMDNNKIVLIIVIIVSIIILIVITISYIIIKKKKN